MQFYCVVRGHQPGIYLTWSECFLQVNGFSNALFRKFSTRIDAEVWFQNQTSSLSIDNNRLPNDGMSDNLMEINPDNGEYTIVFTDGSCITNPNGNKTAGFAYYIPSLDRKINVKIENPPLTNNRAELLAILTAIQEFPVCSKIEIVTDSRYSILVFTSPNILQTIHNSKPIINYDLVSQAVALTTQYDLKFRYIKAHTGKSDFYSQGNSIVDQLARESALSTPNQK